MSASPRARAGGQGQGPRPAAELNKTCGSTEHARPGATEGRSGSALRVFRAADGKDPRGVLPSPGLRIERLGVWEGGLGESCWGLR